MPSIISVQNMSKTFRAADGSTVHALENINLDVEKGEFIALIERLVVKWRVEQSE